MRQNQLLPFSEPQAQLSPGERDVDWDENTTLWNVAVEWTRARPPSSELWSEILVYSRYDHQVAEGHQREARKSKVGGYLPHSQQFSFAFGNGEVGKACACSGRALQPLYTL